MHCNEDGRAAEIEGHEDGRDAETQGHEDGKNHSAAGSRGEFILCELGLNKINYHNKPVFILLT